MPTLLTLRHAACFLGVSPGRLYRAMGAGWLPASPGGGPGKPTLMSLEALQTFCQGEGLRVPEAAEAGEERPARFARAERPVSADADLLDLLQALLPRPRDLRALGVETFPLARLNARLAPLGYVIEAKKVRDRARFVACTDAHGEVEPFGLFALRTVAIKRCARHSKESVSPD